MNETLLRIKKAFTVLLFGGVLVSIINFLTSSFIIKEYSTLFFGEYTFSISYILFFSAIFSTQSWQPLVRYLQEEREPINDNNIIISFYICEIVFSLLGYILALYLDNKLTDFFNSHSPITSYGLAIILFSQNNTFFGLFRFKNKHHYISIIQVTLYGLILFFCIINKNKITNPTELIEYTFIAYLISYILALVLFIKIIKLNSIDFRKLQLVYSIKMCFPFYITILTDSPMRDITIFIINKYFGSNLVGFYRILTQFGGVFTKLTQPIYQASYSEVVRLFYAKKLVELKKIIIKIIKISMSYLLLLSIPIVITYDFWVSLFFSSTYIQYKLFFIIYIICQILIGTSVIINSAYLAIASGWQMFICTATINTIFVILLYFSTTNFGFIGILISILIQVLLTIFWKSIYIKKSVNINEENIDH
ncbi:hypothetical protein Q4Q78_10860 [Morganella morganii]|nr:hypothetical protein [Morganella morganii]